MKNLHPTGGCFTCERNLRPLPVGVAGESSPIAGLSAEPASGLKIRAALLAVAGILFLGALLLQVLPHSLTFPFFNEAFFLLAYGLAGGRTIRDALRSLRRGFILNENFLVSLAGVGAIAIGELAEAAVIMILFNLGELLEAAAVQRSRRSIAALMETRPDYANLVIDDHLEERVTPEAVMPGDEIIVRPGEKIPLDGEVAAGSSHVNNAALTGEAVPLRVDPGDLVLAGAVNGSGLLRIRVSRRFSESSLAQIYRLVQESAARKAPAERFMAKFARYYTPAVVGGAVLLAVVPPLVIPGANLRTWLYRALVFLVIACPCALVISIPLGYLGGIGSAAKQGILVKGANFLEALCKVKVVAFDKTGTLTEGVFRVTRIVPAPGLSEAEVLDWAAHAEAYSNHPLARSIREAYPGYIRRDEVTAYEERGGLGVRAKVRGKTVLVGGVRLLQRERITAVPNTLPEDALCVAVEGEYVGFLSTGDRVRPDAAGAVQQLKKLGVRRIALLTGDNVVAAEEAARQTGVDLAYASLLPEEKVFYLEALQGEAAAAGGKLAYIGDGVNDAPALSRADIGVAMGSAGADAAIEAADVVIMDDQLLKIATAVRIAIFTRRVVGQNILLALGVKGFFIAAGALGATSIWGALLADVGVALLAIINSTRVLWPK